MLASKKSKWKNVQRKLTNDKNDSSIGFASNIEPELCVFLLNIPSVQNFTRLKSKLRSSSTSWMEGFLNFGGLEVLFEGLRRLSGKRLRFVDAFVLLECVNCIKEVMNSKTGLNYMIHDKMFSRNLVKGI